MRPINIQYTSGTTGNPKGATLSHHNILTTVTLSRDSRAYRNDRLCIPSALPLLRLMKATGWLHDARRDDGLSC